MERNRILFLLKNFSLRYLLLIFPMWLLTEVGLTFYSLKNGFFIERIKVMLYFTNLKNLKKILISRKNIQRVRLRLDREMLPYLTDIVEFQDINSFILTTIGNPIYKIYFRLLKILV